jgi:glutaconate CoA-transferase subunit B
MQVRSLHPGVSLAQVQESTGFELHVPAHVAVTPDPSAEQLALLAKLDPHNLRATALG